MAVSDAPTLAFATKDDFRAWLTDHVADEDGVWIKFAKKASGVQSISPAEALDVALCFGWIDGQRRPFDGTFFLNRYTPRRARSRWSKINVGKVQALVESGEMTAHGLAEADRAKADGRWDAAYEPASRAELPADFLAALAENPAARATFATITSSSRYAIFYRLHDAKKPETRQRRLEQFIEQLAAGGEVHPAPTRKEPTT